MNETIQKHSTNNTKHSRYKYTYYQNTHTLQNPCMHTPTHYKTHTYTHPHITKLIRMHTHTLQNPHVTKQVKTTAVQDTHQIK